MELVVLLHLILASVFCDIVVSIGLFVVSSDMFCLRIIVYTYHMLCYVLFILIIFVHIYFILRCLNTLMNFCDKLRLHKKHLGQYSKLTKQ